MQVTKDGIESQTSRLPLRSPASRPTTQMAVGCFVIPLIVAVGLGAIFIYIRSNASARLTVPANKVLRVYAAPDSSSPLLARFGQGYSINITGRSPDWRWLEVELWDGRPGWALRPLDILVWQLRAPETTASPLASPPLAVTPVTDKMIAIPAATFTRGSPPGLGEADETPAHTINLSAFELDRTEVTIGQFWQCVEAGGCAAPVNESSGAEAHYLSDPAFDNYPVVNVPWVEASHYCAWRGKRLPTEAEWEMAAGWDSERGVKLQWPWGNDSTQGEANVGETGLGQAAMVGSFELDKSPSGVMDMAGNVSEWVFDWYKVDYYRVADNSNPVGPTHRRGEGTGRVVRGGAFADSLNQARTANRRHQEEGYGYPSVGFRCARDKQ